MIINELKKAIDDSDALPYTEQEVIDSFNKKFASVGVVNLKASKADIGADGNVLITFVDDLDDEMVAGFGVDGEFVPFTITGDDEDGNVADFEELDLEYVKPPILDSSTDAHYLDLLDLSWLTDDLLATLFDITISDPIEGGGVEAEPGEEQTDKAVSDEEVNIDDEPFTDDVGESLTEQRRVRRLGSAVTGQGRKGRVVKLKWVVRKGKKYRKPLIRWIGKLKPKYKIALKKSARKSIKRRSVAARKRRISSRRRASLPGGGKKRSRR